MGRRKKIKSALRETAYWSDVCITVSQVFFGIAAAAVMVGPLDQNKIIMLPLALMLTISFWLLGWRLVHD